MLPAESCAHGLGGPSACRVTGGLLGVGGTIGAERFAPNSDEIVTVEAQWAFAARFPRMGLTLGDLPHGSMAFRPMLS
jgi:hypothetical protein